MTEFQSFFGSLAGILAIAGYVPYIAAIVWGKARPTKSTWIVWTLVNCVIALGMYREGALSAQITVFAAGNLSILILSLFRGDPGWTTRDTLCCIGAAVGIGFMFAYPLASIFIGLAVNAFATWPTLAKAWREPEKESALAWGTTFSSSIAATLAAMPEWSLASAAQPLVFLALSGSILFVVIFRPLFWGVSAFFRPGP